MIAADIEIINKLGLHARAASKLVAVCAAYGSTISVRKGSDGNAVDAKSIMSVMLLAAAKGSILNFEINGNDEQQAWSAIKELIDNRFDEDE